MLEFFDNNFYVDFKQYSLEDKSPMYTFHYHKHYEIYYLMSGERNYLVDYNMYHVLEGDIVLIPPGVLHMTKTVNQNEKHERIVVNFNDSYLEELGSGNALLRECFKTPHIRLPQKSQKQLPNLFFKILEEHKKNSPFSKQLIKNYVYELLVMIYKILNEEKVDTVSEISNNEISKAAKYIYNHYSEKITLNQVAAICHMNPSYFSRLFKQVMGINFTSYINAIRIREASFLLTNTDLSILNVANSCGFFNIKHFCNIFKEAKGMTASEYRNKMKT